MAVVALFVTSCGSDDDPVIDQSPKLALKGGTEYISEDATVNINEPFTIGVTAFSNTDSKAKLTSVKYTVTTNNQIMLEGDSTFKESSFDYDYSFTFPMAGSAVIKFTVTDKKGETASKSLNITAAPEVTTTPLSEAHDFMWTRVGSAAATGLDTFGLKWTANVKDVKAKIVKDGATKMVKLNTSDWTNITTSEDLEKAITNGTDMGAFHEISVDASNTYDIVLGVENDSVFNMIHVTKAEIITSTGAGTTINISGNYKTNVPAVK